MTVTSFSFLLPIPDFSPPLSTTPLDSTSPGDSAPQTFGGVGNHNTQTGESASTSEGGGTLSWATEAITTTGFTAGGADSTAGRTSTPGGAGILWGAMAAAAVGAFVAETQRRQIEAQEERNQSNYRQEIHARKLKEAEEEAHEERVNAAYAARWEGLAQMEAQKAQAQSNAAYAARWQGVAEQEEAKKKAEQARQNAVDAARWAGLASVMQGKQDQLDKKNLRSKYSRMLKPITKMTASGGIEEIVIIVILTLAVVVGLYLDANRRHRVEGVCLPGSTLANCFNDKGRIEFAENQPISNQEFQDFLSAVKTDIDTQERNPYSLLLSDYDTPFFFDGNPRVKLPWQEDNPDRVVCIETYNCSHQSSVNYVAQGMYSAASEQSLEDAIELANNWNLQYFHPATPEEIYW